METPVPAITLRAAARPRKEPAQWCGPLAAAAVALIVTQLFARRPQPASEPLFVMRAPIPAGPVRRSWPLADAQAAEPRALEAPWAAEASRPALPAASPPEVDDRLMNDALTAFASPPPARTLTDAPGPKRYAPTRSFAGARSAGPALEVAGQGVFQAGLPAPAHGAPAASAGAPPAQPVRQYEGAKARDFDEVREEWAAKAVSR